MNKKQRKTSSLFNSYTYQYVPHNGNEFPIYGI